MSEKLTLVSHYLCPYVQRAIIALTEKGVPHERLYIDLADKPDWFKMISPLGKTPVLLVGETPVFESAVILEYLEDTQRNPLHPPDALQRAEHRSWIEFGSSVLNDIAGFYSAPDRTAFESRTNSLRDKFARLDTRLKADPWFDGALFSLVDAVFGPVFRYFDVFEEIGDFGILADKPRLALWRASLAERASIRDAVAKDYPRRLERFLLARNSHLCTLMNRE